MNSKPVLLLGAFLLCTASAFAQGKIQFNWHGDDNVLQASFQTTAEEAAWPYGLQSIDTPLMQQTLTITSPDHVYPAGSLDVNLSPNLNTMFLYEEAFPTRGILFGYSPGGQWVIGEVPYGKDGIGSGWITRESGHWESHVVPEPSCAALLGLGLLALCMKRATSPSSL